MRRFFTAAVLLATLAGCDVVRVENRTGSAAEDGPAGARLDYVEMPAADPAAVDRARSFYEQAFGWQMTAFGPDYAATTSGDTDFGISAAGGDDAIDKPLPVIRVQDLEAALAAVEQSGGTIKRPIFAFPGGRRFHAIDPAGNEFAVYVVDDGETGN